MFVVNGTADVAPPLHTTWVAGWFNCADGFTVIVNTFGVPVQLTPKLVNVGVTVIVATSGTVPVLIAVNDGMLLPEPTDTNPILVLLLVHE